MRELDNDKGEVKELTLGLNPDRFTLDTLRMPAFYVLDKKAALDPPPALFALPSLDRPPRFAVRHLGCSLCHAFASPFGRPRRLLTSPGAR